VDTSFPNICTTLTSRLRKVVSQVFRHDGRDLGLQSFVEGQTWITATSYDAHDRPLTVTAPTGVATAYVYDGFGDLIQESNPNTGTTVYHYDSTGNRIERVAATGAVTNYTYDALDRVLTSTFPSDSAENVTYTYDQSGHGAGIGRLTSMSDAAGTLSRSYDQLGNLLTDARTAGTVNLTTTYTYDAANRIASITYPSGAVVSYTRDTMGHVSSVSAQPSGGTSTPVVSSVAYKPFGPYSGLTYGNAVAETRGFDQDYRLTGIADAGTATLQNLSYAYYATNNVQAITDAVNSANSQTFSYDNLQRLSGAAGGYGSLAYTYDNDGNRLSQTHGIETTSYGYGTGSDLLATLSVGGVQTQAIGYTADGRISSLSPGIQAPGGQYITSLSYNQDARLSAVNAAGGALASYTYDGFGQRMIKTVSGSYGEIYQYGQNGMVQEATSVSGVTQADYIYLDGRPIATLNPSTGALYFLHDDMLGTPQLATNNSQSVAWQATYQPFGQASVSGTVTQKLRFPGQYFDLESGWNHNGFRNYLPDLGRYMEPDPLGMQGSGSLYNPATGRFISKDPAGFGGSATNLYAYAGDSPTNFADPLGLYIGVSGDYMSYVEAISYLQGSSIAAGIIQQLENSSTVYMVYANDASRRGSEIRQGQPTKADWMPHAGNCGKHGMQSPALQLIHELIHMLQYQQGRPRILEGPNGFYDNWEEADNQIVNSIARQLGEPTKDSYYDATEQPRTYPIPMGPGNGKR
jgi:RHS repeat-associated protein